MEIIIDTEAGTVTVEGAEAIEVQSVDEIAQVLDAIIGEEMGENEETDEVEEEVEEEMPVEEESDYEGGEEEAMEAAYDNKRMKKKKKEHQTSQDPADKSKPGYMGGY